MPRWLWMLKQLTRRLWVRATLIGVLGVVAAILAAVVERFVPWDLPGSIGADAVDSILNIIASSMLAVTTFSLSVMTSAYGSATSNVSPRATKLLMEDRVTQNVLSTFIGSFLFSIVGIVVLKTGAYGDRGRVILFFVTVGVIVLIVVSLLRWIDHLTRLGRVGETTDRVEEATRQAIQARLELPYLGGTPLKDRRAIPAASMHVNANAIGDIQHVDMAALSRLAGEIEKDIFLTAIPGTFVYPDTTLARVNARNTQTDGDILEEVRKAFTIARERSFDQDPRFGLSVMSEIASRALSPAVNDPGTAIDVIGRLVRLMSLWAGDDAHEKPEEPRFPKVHVPMLETRDMFEDGFMPIARDGAALVEVQLRLQKALLALSRMGDRDFHDAALAEAGRARDHAEAALALKSDKTRLREAIRNGQKQAGAPPAKATRAAPGKRASRGRGTARG